MNIKILFYIKNHTKQSSMLVLSIIGLLLPGLVVTAYADNGIKKESLSGHQRLVGTGILHRLLLNSLEV